MINSKKELAVAALENGTVIDHIPSSALFKAVEILGIQSVTDQLTIGNNLHSNRLGAKGIIKVANQFFPESTLNRIAIIAPGAVVNIIRNFEVVEKLPVILPDRIIGIVKCNNPKCISNNEPMKTKFHLINRQTGELRCHYCGHTITADKATII